MQDYTIFKMHYSLTLYMTGLIWIIQVIHYPLFKLVGAENYVVYHKSHIQRTSVVIAVPMLLEMLSALYLILKAEFYRNSSLFLVASLLILVIWLVTFFISVPQHNILVNGFDDTAFKTLLNTNWVRTIGWTLRAVLLYQLLK